MSRQPDQPTDDDQQWAERQVANAPPLSQAQRGKLAVILSALRAKRS